MKKEKDEITELFRSTLTNAEMTVRDGFWEEMMQDIPVAYQRRRRIIFFRVAAAASVLLVLAASSATFWYFSPKEEIEEAFTQIVAANEGKLDGDGVIARPLMQPVQSVLTKPTPKSYGILKQYTDEEDEESVTLSMSFSFSSTTTVRHGNKQVNEKEGLWQAGIGNEEVNRYKEEEVAVEKKQIQGAKVRHWAVKAQVGTALPAEGGTYKMPVTAGVTVERKLNKYLGVETGVLYSNLRSDGRSLHYLGIPVKMNITLVDTKKWDVYTTVGGVADKCIAGAPDNDFKNEPIQLAVLAGVGVRYKINDRLAVFAEPGVSHHFKTDSQLPTVRTERPTNFNLLCGLRMTY